MALLVNGRGDLEGCCSDPVSTRCDSVPTLWVPASSRRRPYLSNSAAYFSSSLHLVIPKPRAVEDVDDDDTDAATLSAVVDVPRTRVVIRCSKLEQDSVRSCVTLAVVEREYRRLRVWAVEADSFAFAREAILLLTSKYRSDLAPKLRKGDENSWGPKCPFSVVKYC